MNFFIALKLGLFCVAGISPEPLKVYDVMPDSASSTFGSYHTIPESPDGKNILVLCFDSVPAASPSSITAGSLWIYRRETGEREKLVDLYGVGTHDGAMAMWIDNDLIVYQDGKLRPINVPPEYDTYSGYPPRDEINSFNIKTGEKKTFPIQGRLGHDAVNGWFPLSVMHPMNGFHGAYMVNAYSEEIRLICKPEKFDAVVPDDLKQGREPAQKWRLLHVALSPDGEMAAMRMDMLPLAGSSLPTLNSQVIINTDGTDPIFWRGKIPLHFNWYGENIIAGHAGFDASIGMGFPGPMQDSPLMEGSDGRGGVYAFQVRPSQLIERLAPMGNHLAWSPDGNWFVSENWYRTETVIMKLYRKYSDVPAALLMQNSDGAARCWNSTVHVNPSFSRDGQRVYFTEVMDGNRFQARWTDIGPVLTAWANNQQITFEREDIMNTNITKMLGTAAAATSLTVNVIAGNMTAEASSFASTDKGQMLPEYAIDGNPATMWGAQERREWLQIDLGEEQLLSEISIMWGGTQGRCYIFSIETSIDSNTWKRAYSGEHDGIQRVFKNYQFSAPRAARYVKIFTQGYNPSKGGGGNGKWTYICEVKFK
ncbi:MAG: discoidin domain-containing protein [Kiritimatiellales bacterium]